MAVLLDTSIGFDEDDSGDLGEESESSGGHEFREIILQQSVTMLAYMDRNSSASSAADPGTPEPRMMLGFTVTDLTILVGAAIGAAGLILIILTTFIIWHCCKFRGRPDKAYCLDNSSPDEASMKQGNGSMLHSDSVVFLGTKCNQVSTRTIGIKNEICQSILTRSQSVPLKEGKELPKLSTVTRQFSKKRPISQPVAIQTGSSYSPKRAHSVHPHNSLNYRHLDEGEGLPSIPEGGFRGSEVLQDGITPNLYASCNALDGPCVYSSLYTAVPPHTTMKTRSLPLWGRSKPRPLSTEDDLNELYAKVNFSKKRKNRMRSDSAAAIAVNKSRPTHHRTFAHKDTDSLVENEAVVVYDERTAL